jgi:Domain of unknown function (DUF1906)
VRTVVRHRISRVVTTLVIAVGGMSTAIATTASAEQVVGMYGFDTRCAPTAATMQAWLESPYRFVGIYIGGAGLSCPDADQAFWQDGGWVAQVSAMGWKFEPIYYGVQAPCAPTGPWMSRDLDSAAQQAVADANDAADRMTTLGFLPDMGNPIYKDMESYTRDPVRDLECSQATIAYENWWTATIHGRGYISGIYGGGYSTIRDLADRVDDPNALMPDAIICADYDRVANTSCPTIDDNYWVFHQRGKQYDGDTGPPNYHPETFGGVTINTDDDYMDGPLAVPTPPFDPVAG